jgi:hypothetical protein
MRNLALFALLASACTTTDSSDVLTHGMYADVAATTEGTGQTTVSATLYLGNPINLDFVQLTGDDALVASFDGSDKTMTETTILNIVSHTATFDSGDPGDEFHIAFERSVDAGAPDSVVTLPDAFDITPPPSTLSRGDAIDIPYGPAGTADVVHWSVRGDCIDLASGSLQGDTGTVPLEANMLVLRQGSTQTSCLVTLEIDRERDGNLDRGYGKGGTAIGRQSRTVTWTSTL